MTATMVERLYTTAEAAAELNVPATMIATWKQRGHIHPADSIRGTGRTGVVPLYRLDELRPLVDAYHRRGHTTSSRRKP